MKAAWAVATSVAGDISLEIEESTKDGEENMIKLKTSGRVLAFHDSEESSSWAVGAAPKILTFLTFQIARSQMIHPTLPARQV